MAGNKQGSSSGHRTFPSSGDLLRQVGGGTGGGRDPADGVDVKGVIGFGEVTPQPGIAGLQPFSSQEEGGPSGVAFAAEKDLPNGHHAGVTMTGFGSKDEATNTVAAGGGVYFTGGEGLATGAAIDPDTGRPVVPSGQTGGYVGLEVEAWKQGGPESGTVETSGLAAAVRAGLNVPISPATNVRLEAAYVTDVSGAHPAGVGALGDGSSGTACVTHNVGSGVQVGACVGADKQNGPKAVLGFRADF